MDIVKIIGIGIISLITIIILKQYKPEFGLYISILAGILIITLSMDKLNAIVTLLLNITSKTGTGTTFLKILLKITGIAILTEFAVSLCKDAGENSIANKIDLGGKVIIISISIPIITALLELIIDIMWMEKKCTY